ncbi:DUF177 domain-containing protein [Sphingomonas sp. CL5.1]|uniref:YceD family protein n=1 Tax=Sphingomonas sp. CL5.1 TaxID=2653203 RepID=UPI001582127E|nr:YceD family protein [Sphingomonas sp. CL5.1]QKR99016.1 DUF177 domain-containing protein [Sphingomonas sp. CL5.1]
MMPEFSRPERLDTIGGEPREVTISADAGERRRLAARFGLVGIERLEATFTIRRDIAGIRADGRVTAAVTQACSVTGDPLPATVDEAVALRFVPPGESGEEIELDENALDTIEIEGGAIDLGEAAAETLALALDPFPRGPRAAEALREAGVAAEDQAGPFGALAALKGKLGK